MIKGLGPKYESVAISSVSAEGSIELVVQTNTDSGLHHIALHFLGLLQANPVFISQHLRGGGCGELRRGVQLIGAVGNRHLISVLKLLKGDF
ncbi:unannotated protein [freshwater metagenome]|uniref:Unannotated protein n=1 Tax=freshwater metagenome TaxID=449393 RepID=A0A6J7SE44_9ZZZZ